MSTCDAQEMYVSQISENEDRNNMLLLVSWCYPHQCEGTVGQYHIVQDLAFEQVELYQYTEEYDIEVSQQSSFYKVVHDPSERVLADEDYIKSDKLGTLAHRLSNWLN